MYTPLNGVAAGLARMLAATGDPNTSPTLTAWTQALDTTETESPQQDRAIEPTQGLGGRTPRPEEPMLTALKRAARC